MQATHTEASLAHDHSYDRACRFYYNFAIRKPLEQTYHNSHITAVAEHIAEITHIDNAMAVGDDINVRW
jgi:hypothetical protein